MNREIKFRAWDTRGKSWLYPYPEGFHLFGETTCFDLIRDQMHERYPGESSLLLMNEVEVVQYTGLKDKNGKEIYEGDIVRYKEFERFREGESVHVSVVKYYCEPNSRVGFEPMVWHTKVEDGYYNSELEDYEVIGNIYENPELLEGK